MSKYLQKLHLMDSSLYGDSILYILLCLLQTVWQLSPHLTTYTEQKEKSNSVLVFSVKVYLASKMLRRYSVNYTSDFFCVKSQIPQARPASALLILQRGRQMGASFTRWCEFKGLNYKVLKDSHGVRRACSNLSLQRHQNQAWSQGLQCGSRSLLCSSGTASDFSCMLRVSILLNSVILILQDAQSCKRRTTQCHCSFESMMSDAWRKYSQAWDTLFQTEQKTRDPHTFTLLVINIEIRHWSAVKNMKAVLVSALGMGSFWSWKALKGSSLFSCSYFCLSEHKLLQPLPRLLVSKKRKAVSI